MTLNGKRPPTHPIFAVAELFVRNLRAEGGLFHRSRCGWVFQQNYTWSFRHWKFTRPLSNYLCAWKGSKKHRS